MSGDGICWSMAQAARSMRDTLGEEVGLLLPPIC